MSGYGSGTYGSGTYGEQAAPSTVPAWVHHPTHVDFAAGELAGAISASGSTGEILPSVPTSAEVAAHELRALVAGAETLAGVGPSEVRADVQDAETLAEVA